MISQTSVDAIHFNAFCAKYLFCYLWEWDGSSEGRYMKMITNKTRRRIVKVATTIKISLHIFAIGFLVIDLLTLDIKPLEKLFFLWGIASILSMSLMLHIFSVLRAQDLISCLNTLGGFNKSLGEFFHKINCEKDGLENFARISGICVLLMSAYFPFMFALFFETSEIDLSRWVYHTKDFWTNVLIGTIYAYFLCVNSTHASGFLITMLVYSNCTTKWLELHVWEENMNTVKKLKMQSLYRAHQLIQQYNMELGNLILPLGLVIGIIIMAFSIIFVIIFHDRVNSAILFCSVGVTTFWGMKKSIELIVSQTSKSQIYVRSYLATRSHSNRDKAEVAFFRACPQLQWKLNPGINLTTGTFPSIMNEIVLDNVISMLVYYRTSTNEA